MKSRVTLTLTPQVLHRAKKLAHKQHTSVSGLIESLLLTASSKESTKPAFAHKWLGALKLSGKRAGDPLFKAIKAKHGLA